MKENIVTLLYFLGIMGAILMYFVFPNDIMHAILFGAICLIITIIPELKKTARLLARSLCL